MTETLMSALELILSGNYRVGLERIPLPLAESMECKRAGLAFANGPNYQANGMPPPDLRQVFGKAPGQTFETGDHGEILAASLTCPHHGPGAIWAEANPHRAWQSSDHAMLRHVAAVVSVTRNNSTGRGEHLQATSRVASRIAHDFDNVLTGVIGFAELTLPLLGASPARQYVQELLRVGQQGAVYTRRLHQIGREISAQTRPTQLGKVLPTLISQLQQSLPESTKINVTIAPDLPSVAIESTPLQTALEPILANATEAGSTMPIEITAELYTSGPEERARMMLAPGVGPCVMLAVRDQGKGITEETHRKLFIVPCFSTKARHRGLGLTLVYRTLQAHGAGFDLVSTPPGTTARLYLPAIQG